MNYKEELEIIRNKSGGVLKPRDVVAFAQNKKTALHKHFIWDDTEAAHQYRLEQARRLIRVVVTVSPNTGNAVRAYVSLRSDKASGDSYRTLVDVMSDDDLKAKLLDQALADLIGFRNKYNELREEALLSPVFISIEDAVEEADHDI